MPKGRGKRHTAKEHRIYNAVRRSKSGKRLSESSAWKIVMSQRPKARGRKKR